MLFTDVGDEGTASVHSHSSTGYYSGFHSSTGLHSGSSSSITMGGGPNHFSPTHNGLPTTKLPAYNRNSNYPSHNYQHMENTVYNPLSQVYSQGYLGYPTAPISSASSTGHTSQYQLVYTPKVSCPMAKVAPYSAQVNRVVTMPTSSSSLSADSTSYQDMTNHDAQPHMMLQQIKALSLEEDGMYGPVDGANYGSKWNGLIELKDQIMMQKDQLVERYIE